MAETYVLNAYLSRLRLSEHTTKLALSIVEREQARPQVNRLSRPSSSTIHLRSPPTPISSGFSPPGRMAIPGVFSLDALRRLFELASLKNMVLVWAAQPIKKISQTYDGLSLPWRSERQEERLHPPI